MESQSCDSIITVFLQIGNSQVQMATIVRPLNMIDFDDMTEAAKGRLAYSMLDIDRSADVFDKGAVDAVVNISDFVIFINDNLCFQKNHLVYYNAILTTVFQ